ncbi:DMT family transporter [Nesterenkonia sp. MY13]|uniref:DMT family transporter n=1 Tax=Nesterenkonia sedimenti TaxID=1463632 RepID=A0A7X8TIE1_9MICC|nr:DMT family transporter [Nesterenkonia sedimenti]NLS09318.1 DMT family transporter [Nesterenkonia sedimenti]
MISAPRAVALMLLGSLAMAGSAAIIFNLGAEPMSVAAYRCLLAVPMLLPFVLWELRRVDRSQALPKSTVIGAAIGGVAIGVDYSFYNASIGLIGPGLATVLINIQIVILPLIAWAVEGQRPMRQLLVIVPLMMAGVAFAAGAFDDAEIHWFGILAGLIAGAGYATYLAIIRRTAPVTLRPAPLTVVTIVCLTAGLTAGGGALFSGRLEVPTAGQDWLWLVALAFVGQVVVYLCFNIAMTGLNETVSSTLMLTGPIFAILLGALLFTEVPTLWQLGGCAMIIAGAWWAATASRRT